MMSSLDTRITFFGGAVNPAVIEGMKKLAAAGYEIAVCECDPREYNQLRDLGVEKIPNRVEAMSDCQVVITSLSTSAAVEELYLGDNGLLELADQGTCFMDVSFSSPQLAREIEAMAAISDIQAIDAPVLCLGEKEEAVMFVGGEQDARDQLAPLFPYLAATVIPEKEAGEGQFAAMLAIISLAGSLMGTVEALSLAHISGFPEHSAVGVLATTAGGSRALVDYGPQILKHDYKGSFRVSSFLEALGVALETADKLEVTLPMVETAYQLYDLLCVVGGESLNIQALALLYEDEQTCADYGLDWSLADGQDGQMDDDDYGYDGYEGGPLGGLGNPSQGGGQRPRGSSGGGLQMPGSFFSKN